MLEPVVVAGDVEPPELAGNVAFEIPPEIVVVGRTIPSAAQNVTYPMVINLSIFFPVRKTELCAYGREFLERDQWKFGLADRHRQP